VTKFCRTFVFVRSFAHLLFNINKVRNLDKKAVTPSKAIASQIGTVFLPYKHCYVM